MDRHRSYLMSLMAKDGPEQNDYYDLDAWIIEVSEQSASGKLNSQDIEELVGLLGDAASAGTMQGFVLHKPHGYAGEFEIIDKFYQNHVSPLQHLARWDTFWHSYPAAQAVRNRAHYLNALLLNHCSARTEKPLEVLNIASGPGRDLLHFFDKNPNANVHIDCIEQDKKAIRHASDLCKDHIAKLTFIEKNALRFNTDKKYDLIWSAGLFDYFNDDIFAFMLKKLSGMLVSDGEIVIGNFSTKNPSRAYMELFDWKLHHRSPHTLMCLALESGFRKENIEVRKEETGVNLFLHLKAQVPI